VRTGAGGTIRILRAAERAATPWKNGGGLTRELVVHPPWSDLTQFDWRVSIAEIRAAGPFSRFPGIERRMAILEGRLSLSIGEDAAMIATPETPPLAFPGEAAVFAEPCGGPVTDFNVITRRGRFDSRLTSCATGESWPLTVQVGPTLILALSDLEVGCDARRANLAKLDALLVDGESHCTVVPRSATAFFWLVEIRACGPEAPR
jgi:environmental stress-induced protein Ves